jgi:hypothetical protein
MEDGPMSIVVRFHPTNATKDKYDESLRRMEAAGIWPDPPGLEVHVAFGSEDDLRVSEIWSSREQFQAYGEKLMPILDEMPNPRFSRFRTSSSSNRLAEARSGGPPLF